MIHVWEYRFPHATGCVWGSEKSLGVALPCLPPCLRQSFCGVCSLVLQGQVSWLLGFWKSLSSDFHLTVRAMMGFVYQVFMWVLGVRTQDLMLAKQAPGSYIISKAHLLWYLWVSLFFSPKRLALVCLDRYRRTFAFCKLKFSQAHLMHNPWVLVTVWVIRTVASGEKLIVTCLSAQGKCWEWKTRSDKNLR